MELDGAAYDANNTYAEVPKEAVESLDDWERKHFGGGNESDEDDI